MSGLKPDEQAIFIIRTAGKESFKGSGFVRGGIYDRVQVRQGLDTFTFRDLDYLNLYGLEAAGAPRFSESAIFIVRSGAFSGAYPWKLALLGNRVDRADRRAQLRHLRAGLLAAGAWALEGGRPAVRGTGGDLGEASGRRARWRSGSSAAAGGGRHRLRAARPACAALHAQGQVAGQRLQVLDLGGEHRVGRLRDDGAALHHPGADLVPLAAVPLEWALFLRDPLIFLFWCFIIITVFIWGRGLFCGWLCPYRRRSARRLYKVAGATRAEALPAAAPKGCTTS